MSPENTTISNAALKEEIEVINAIYGTDVGTSIKNTNQVADSIDHIILCLPNQSISFILSFNPNYPRTRPQINGIQSTGSLGKGEGHHAVKLIQSTLERVWTPGAVCLFDLIEEVEPLLLLQDGAIESSEPDVAEKSEIPLPEGEEGEGLTKREAEATIHSSHYSVPNWTVSGPLTEKKSVFIARCARVTGQEEATSFLTHLLSTNKKVAAATHNITAWRIQNSEMGATVQDCDDDGETAAGGRLLHLLQLMDVWNVIVVVTRWYGGVKLGPDRFRYINQAAREALVKGGFVRMEEENKPNQMKRKKYGNPCP